MNIKYLKRVLIPQREREVENGDNLATRDPIYVVYSLRDQYVSGHSDFSPTTNLQGKHPESGYLYRKDPDDEPQFCLNEDGSDIDEYMEASEHEAEEDGFEEVTRLWVDRLEAIFLTSKAAYDFIGYQGHNLSNPYVYVHHAGYRNREMDMLLATPPTFWTRVKKWFKLKFKRK